MQFLGRTRQDIIVEEREASDQVREAIIQLSVAVDHVAVVTEQLEETQHGQASVREFRNLAAFHFGRVQFRVGFGVEQVSVVVDGTNQEEHLGPTQGRDGFNGLDSVGDVIRRKLSGNQVVVGTAEFGPDVANLSRFVNQSNKRGLDNNKGKRRDDDSHCYRQNTRRTFRLTIASIHTRPCLSSASR